MEDILGQGLGAPRPGPAFPHSLEPPQQGWLGGSWRAQSHERPPKGSVKIKLTFFPFSLYYKHIECCCINPSFCWLPQALVPRSRLLGQVWQRMAKLVSRSCPEPQDPIVSRDKVSARHGHRCLIPWLHSSELQLPAFLAPRPIRSLPSLMRSEIPEDTEFPHPAASHPACRNVF